VDSHPKPLQDLVIIIYFERKAKFKTDVGTSRAHLALHNSLGIGIDDNERERYFLILIVFVRICALCMLVLRSSRLRKIPRVVSSEQVLKANILHHELLEALRFLTNILLPLLDLHLQLLHALASAQPVHLLALAVAVARAISKMVLDRASRQAAPCDLLLILRDNIHRHQNIECVINAATYILIVVITLVFDTSRLRGARLDGFIAIGDGRLLDGLLGLHQFTHKLSQESNGRRELERRGELAYLRKSLQHE
jgi:hypothetical protein